jgi:recombination protein RecA
MSAACGAVPTCDRVPGHAGSEMNRIDSRQGCANGRFTSEHQTGGRRVADKNKALDAALSQIERAFGKGSIMRMGARTQDEHIDVIPSGSLGLDIALGIGGLPRGRIIEVYGPESSGKTTLALHAIAEAQKRGGTCAFIDAEHALDPIYARKLGVDVDNLLISQPDAGEQALEICDTLVRSGAIDVLVIDSVAALVPRAELEGEMGDTHVGLHARLMSQALRKLTGSVSKSHTMLIFLNQIRLKIGVMFGNPETTTGGNALKFYASIRLEIRRTGSIKDRENVVGNSTRVKVAKNKLAPPFREVEFDIMFGEGISKVGELIDLGVKAGIVEKSGSWFSFDSTRIGQGRENAKQFLRDHKDAAEAIEKRIREQSGSVADKMLVGPDDAEEAEAAD